MNREGHNNVHTLMTVVEEAARSFSDQRWRLVVRYQAARNRIRLIFQRLSGLHDTLAHLFGDTGSWLKAARDSRLV